MGIFSSKDNSEAKKALNDDFLISEDKEKIDNLSKEKNRHLRIAQKLDLKIIQIQKSTRTLIPNFIPLHNNLRQKYRWYYRWHLFPFSKVVHWLILLLYIVSLPLLIFDLPNLTKKAQATGYDFPRWEWSNPSPTSNALMNSTTCPNGSVWTVGGSGTILNSTDDGNNWQQQYSGTANDLQDIECLSNNNIIAVGSLGTILQYNGIYDSWTQRTSGTTNPLLSITALDTTHLVAVGPTDVTVISSDAGQTWTTKTHDTLELLLSVAALDNNNVIAVGEDGALIASTDAGQTWTTKNSDIGFNTLNDVIALDSTHAIAVGNSGKITVSTDAGQTWTAKVSGTANHLDSVISLDSTHAIAVGNSGTITVSTDAGQTWATKASGTGNGLISVTALDTNNVVTVGVSGTITVSTDAGQTWATKASGTSNFLETVIALDTNQLVAVGEYGTITISSNVGQTWSSKNSGTVIDLNKITSLDSTNAIAIGSSGTITVSTDAGQTWATKASGTGNGLISVTALDTNNVVAVGVSGTITVSTDAGQTWTTKDSGTSNVLYFVTALDANNIVAVGGSGTITVSTDAGQTWNTKASGTSAILLSITALDSNNAIAVGHSGTITVSTDAGQTWATKVSGFGSSDINNVTALDSNNAIAVGNAGKITVSTDAGQTWNTKASGTSAILLSITALDSNNAIAVGHSGTITVSTDAGQTWATKVSGTIYGLYNVTALDSTHATAVGINGTITVSSDSGNTWTIQSSITGQDLMGGIAVLSTYQRYLVAGTGGAILRYYSPANATATKLWVKFPGPPEQSTGQSFADGTGVFGTPSAVRAGDSVTATVYATDGSNVLDKGNASWAGFTSTDPNDVNPGNIQLTNGGNCSQSDPVPEYPCGIGTANFVFHTPGTWTVTASDVYGVLSSGTSSEITVNPGSASKLYFSSLPSSLAMGSTSSKITLGVRDAYNNNTTVSSARTIRLSTSSSSGRFSTSASGPWSEGSLDVTIAAGAGTKNFFYLDFATGTSTITAAEMPSAGWTDASGSITITSGALDDSTLSVDKSSVAAGESLTAQVILKNSEGLALTQRTVQLSSSRNAGDYTPDQISSAAITDLSGIANFTVTPTATGDLTLTAFDQTDNAYVPQTAGVSVGIGSLASISLSASASSVNAGSPLDISLTLYDSFSNIVTGFAGDVSFSSSDSSASFQEGTHSFSASDQGTYSQEVTLNAEGEQSVTASYEGIQDTIYVTVLGEEIAASPTASPGAGTTPSPTSSPEPETLVERLQESPTAKKVARTLTPIATTAAALGLLPLLIQAFPSGFHALAALFPALFAAATIRRKRKPWGMVFDSLSGKPVELAVVRVFNDGTDKLVATKVTDQNGRFNFLVEKGTYYLKVAKPGFIFPARIAKIKADQLSTRFGPETDVYLGQSFAVNTPNANINLNIALDPKENTLSGSDKLKKSLKDGFDWFLIGISYVAIPMLIIGAVFTAFALVVEPTTFNMGLAVVYTFLLGGFLVVRRIRQTKLGIVFDSKTRKPIKGAIVSCFDKQYNALRETKATDANGYFSILAPKGEYYLTIDAKGYHFPAKDQGRKEDRILGKLYYGETIKNTKIAYLKASVPLEKKY